MAQPDYTELKNNISQKIEETEGAFAVAFLDIKTDDMVLINEKDEFHAASTMKTPIMIEIYKQAESGKFKLSDSIMVRNEFKSIVDSSAYSLDISDDGGEELYSFIGKMRTIYDLTYDMITVSSNLATNILIELVQAENIMNTMKSIGAENIQIRRGVEDIKAYQLGLNNTTTAYDLMLILKKIAKKEIVSVTACDEMIKILLDQKFNTVIPARLPAEVKVAHKTGSITGIQHDSGIVYLPDGRCYILVILGKDIKDTKKGIETESEISKIVYDYFVEQLSIK